MQKNKTSKHLKNILKHLKNTICQEKFFFLNLQVRGFLKCLFIMFIYLHTLNCIVKQKRKL